MRNHAPPRERSKKNLYSAGMCYSKTHRKYVQINATQKHGKLVLHTVKHSTNSDRMKSPTGFRLSAKQAQQLAEASEKSRCSRAQIVRAALALFFAKHKSAVAIFGAVANLNEEGAK